MRTGIFVGSFDPFTIGHDSIVRRALPLFDRLVIGVVGDNVIVSVLNNKAKTPLFSVEERVKMLEEVTKDIPNVEVKSFAGLTVDFAKSEDATFIVKGVRSVKDFEYERAQADINRKMSGIETILFYAEPHLESVSSSLVRELAHFGKDVRMFLPEKMERLKD